MTGMLSSSQNAQRFLIDTTSVNRTSSQRLVECCAAIQPGKLSGSRVFVLS